MRVWLYRNLHSKFKKLPHPVWSIATADGKRKLLDTVEGALLSDARLIVQQNRQRAILKAFKQGRKQKEVHAFVEGELDEKWPLGSLGASAGPESITKAKVSRIGYDPYLGDTFVRTDCGVRPIGGEVRTTARGADIWFSRDIPIVAATPEGVFAKLGPCPKGRGLGDMVMPHQFDPDRWNG
jgi:hypothetical protein